MNKAIYYHNNLNHTYMIDDLGVLFDPKSSINLELSIPHEELCESVDLKNAVENGIISIYQNDNKFTISEALDYLTIESFIEDAQNEQWYFEAGTQTKITKYTQLRISGRILTQEENSHVLMDDGSDIIVE